MTIERRRVVYQGRVQGVGFRMTARRLASSHPISGSVRNLDDGRVELIIEGDAHHLGLYLGALQREFGDMIRDITVEQEEPEGEPLSGFSILY
ncbi:acylphosphatase [Tundrisphaera lichenicola]|uniref:acylphosphatase n=1 Tax=Tundrisphaera lichenicola TaxID=2029860 RepID=UPI003EBABE5A